MSNVDDIIRAVSCISMSGVADNDTVQAADAMLQQILENFAVFEQFVIIAANREIPMQVRIGVTILLRKLFNMHIVEISQEIMIPVLKGIVVLADNSEGLEHITIRSINIVGEKFIEFWSLIAPNLFTVNISVKASLMILQSVIRSLRLCIGFMQVDCVAFFMPFLQQIAEVMTQSSDISLVTMCYFIVKKLMKCDDPGNNLVPIAVLAFAHAPRIFEFLDNERFMWLASNVLKCCAGILRPCRKGDFIGPELTMAMLELLDNLINRGLPLRLYDYEAGVVVALLGTDLHRECVRQFGEQRFVIRILLPLFALTPQDEEDSINDPSSFSGSFLVQVQDYSTDRGHLLGALRQYSDLPGVSQAVLQVLMSPECGTSAAFSCLQIISAISDTAGLDPSFFFPMLSHESHLGRCGALLNLQAFPWQMIPLDLYPKIVSMLVDDSILVQYYAIITLSEMLNSEQDRVNDIRMILRENLEFIVAHYFRLIDQYADSEFIMCLETLIRTFGDDLLAAAEQIIPMTFDRYAMFVFRSESPGVILVELFIFVRKWIRSGTYAPAVIDDLMARICALLGEVSNDVRSSIVTLASNILVVCHDNLPSYWAILAAIPQLEQSEESADSFLIYIRNMLLKFTEQVNATVPSDNLLQYAMLCGMNVSDGRYSMLLTSAILDNMVVGDIQAVVAVYMPIIEQFVTRLDMRHAIASLLLSFFMKGFPINEQLCQLFVDACDFVQLGIFTRQFGIQLEQDVFEYKRAVMTEEDEDDDMIDEMPCLFVEQYKI